MHKRSLVLMLVATVVPVSMTSVVSARAQILETCPTVTENCTAGDMDVFNATAVPDSGGDDTCDSELDEIDIVVTVDFETSGAGTNRLDLAVWVPVDEVGPTCEGRFLTEANATNTSNLDGDLCRDIEGGNTVTYTGSYRVPCTDEDEDGKLDDFPVTGSWYQPGGDEVCESAEFAGTTAKCEATASAPDIRVPRCGDDILDPGEECDDGNNESGDGCSALCEDELDPPFCGDGTVDPGEECDDGNTDNTDECLNTCELADCGDGFLWEEMEECDDGNQDPGDGCSAECVIEFCGDGIWQPGLGEECDDGPQGSPTCSSSCELIDQVPSLPSTARVALFLSLLTAGFAVATRVRRRHG